VRNGYYIRKLNQAYFAFYGAYADVPGGPAGEDPVGPAVRALRSQSQSPAVSLPAMGWPPTYRVPSGNGAIEPPRRSSARQRERSWRRLRALRSRIAGGELGEITKTRGYGVHAGWGPSGWFTDPELAGGGALLDMGVHAIDTVRFLLGDPALETVCARIATRYGDYAVDDDGLLLIGWANGTSSLVESGWWHPHLAGLEADTEVYGTAGYARIWDFTEGPEGYEHCAQPMYSAQVAEFIDAVSQGRQPRPSGEDGAVVMDAVERAYRSAGIR